MLELISMTNTPEIENSIPQQVPEGVQEIPETPEIPRHIEQGGVVSHQSQFTAQVQDDSGNQVIDAPATKAVTMKLPASQEQLVAWSEGSPDDSLTGFAVFWLRLIKKALHFGWRAVIGKE